MSAVVRWSIRPFACVYVLTSLFSVWPTPFVVLNSAATAGLFDVSAVFSAV